MAWWSLRAAGQRSKSSLFSRRMYWVSIRRSLFWKPSAQAYKASYISWGGKGAQGISRAISTASPSFRLRIRSILSCSVSRHRVMVARTLMMVSAS